MAIKRFTVGQIITFTVRQVNGNMETISGQYTGRVSAINRSNITVDCSTLYHSRVITAKSSEIYLETPKAK